MYFRREFWWENVNLKIVYAKLKKQEEKLEIEEVKYQKNMVLIKFKGIEASKGLSEKWKIYYLWWDEVMSWLWVKW